MNFLDLAKRLRMEAGIAGTGPDTTVGQAGELGRIVTWIGEAYEDIQNKRNDWGFLRQGFSFNTLSTGYFLTANAVGSVAVGNTITGITSGATGVVSAVFNSLSQMGFALSAITGSFTAEGISVGGVPIAGVSVSGPAKLQYSSTYPRSTVSNLKNWKRDSLRIYLATAGVNDQRWLRFVKWEQFRDTRLRGASQLQTGRPIEFSIDPQKNIITWPIASDLYTITGECFLIPYVLVNDTDLPVFDTNQMAIVYNGLMRYAAYVGDPGIYAEAQKEYGRLIGKIEKEWSQEITCGGSLV